VLGRHGVVHCGKITAGVHREFLPEKLIQRFVV